MLLRRDGQGPARVCITEEEKMDFALAIDQYVEVAEAAIASLTGGVITPRPSG